MPPILEPPKPIVPIFNRPFLHYQIDLLKQVPEIDEVILSLNYQPRRIEEIFGDGSELGIKIRYVVEPAPLGTATRRSASSGSPCGGRRSGGRWATHHYNSYPCHCKTVSCQATIEMSAFWQQ